MSAQTPTERIDEREAARTTARHFFDQSLLPAFHQLEKDFAEHGRQVRIESSPGDSDTLTAEFRVLQPDGEGSEFVYIALIRVEPHRTRSEKRYAPSFQDGRPTSKTKTEPLDLTFTAEQIAEDVQERYTDVTRAISRLRATRG